ncbi:phosphoesterase [Mycolicibacterium anyangense]|uniref:Phosphoesterase n=2 Tax=Mycolicibacterium anyangense TaxID=1431246 RepID=A0A6N4WFX6_9MYCO|nr:phosphoesterase [Mycolicibacterium anyangense]
MVVLGLAVGHGSTPIDAWFQQANGSGLGRLLFFTDVRTMAVVLLVAVLAAMAAKRWFLVVLMVVSPVAAVMIAGWLKRLFGREKDGALAYPSGHTTVMVMVLGMVILLVGLRLWVMLAAGLWTLLGVVGQAVSYHYFTDAVGAVLLASSVLCVVALIEHRPFTPSSPSRRPEELFCAGDTGDERLQGFRRRR